MNARTAWARRMGYTDFVLIDGRLFFGPEARLKHRRWMLRLILGIGGRR